MGPVELAPHFKLPEDSCCSLTWIPYGWWLGKGHSWLPPPTLRRSMLPDVIDDFHLKHPHSPGTEPIFFSFYVFFTKFASGVSLGVSTLSLE